MVVSSVSWPRSHDQLGCMTKVHGTFSVQHPNLKLLVNIAFIKSNILNYEHNSQLLSSHSYSCSWKDIVVVPTVWHTICGDRNKLVCRKNLSQQGKAEAERQILLSPHAFFPTSKRGRNVDDCTMTSAYTLRQCNLKDDNITIKLPQPFHTSLNGIQRCKLLFCIVFEVKHFTG